MFKYNICIPASVDIDELINKWNNDPKIVNYFHRNFTLEEYTVINFIVNEGLKDILGQQPADDPIIDDDPYARPGTDTPNLNPDNPDDEDPYARPSGWNPAEGIYFDPTTGKLINAAGQEVDKDGNVIGEEEPKPEDPSPLPKPDDDNDYIFTTPDADIYNPNWKKWVEYCRLYHPDWYSVPHTPVDENDPDYEPFMAYLKQQEKPEELPEESEENPYLYDWLDYWAETYPDTPAEPFPQDEESPYFEDFMEYLANKYDEENNGISAMPLGTLQEF